MVSPILFSSLYHNHKLRELVDARIVSFDAERHGARFFELNLEYLSWVDGMISERHGISLNPGGTVRGYLEGVFPKFTEIEPPEGVIYVVEVDGEAEGMGVLRRIEEGVGEIKRMYNRPSIRGKGYAKEMLRLLEEKARELGLSTLRLDTGDFMEAAQHIYGKAGFRVIDKYPGGEWVDRDDTEDVAIYMEKRL